MEYDFFNSMAATGVMLIIGGMFAFVIVLSVAYYVAMRCVAAVINKAGLKYGVTAAFSCGCVVILPLVIFGIGDAFPLTRFGMLIFFAVSSFVIGLIYQRHMVKTGEWPRR